MSLIKNIKILTTLIFVASANQAIAAGEVKLQIGFSTTGAHNGASWQDVGATVRVKNLGATKQIFIHSRVDATTWTDKPLTYLGPADAGFELWRYKENICTGFGCAPRDQEWAVKMVYNGVEYWDNNNGQDYKLKTNSGWLLTDPWVMVSDPAYLYSYGGVGAASAKGRVALKNLGVNKTVTVNYTLDGTTWQSKPAAFAYYVPVYGGYGTIPNPNEFGVEIWDFDFPLGTKNSAKYYLSYSVNGQTAKDDNYGRNYTFQLPTKYPSMYVRGTNNAWGTYQMGINPAGFWEGYYIDFAGTDRRFKFDVDGTWATSFGDTQHDYIADLGGPDITVSKPGQYRVIFNDNTKAYDLSCVGGDCYAGQDLQRTVIFIKKQTAMGQNLFIRGGIDVNYAKTKLGRDCTADRFLCAIPIMPNNVVQSQATPDRLYDLYLDWYGAEAGQVGNPAGSPLSWTTNNAAYKQKVAVDGYGYTPLNTWGDHYWMMDVMMDCSKTANGWFELKAFLTNYAVNGGWEGDITQTGAPYTTKNHLGQCGKLNKFEWGNNVAVIEAL